MNKSARRRGTKGAFGCSKVNRIAKNTNKFSTENFKKLLEETGVYNFSDSQSEDAGKTTNKIN